MREVSLYNYTACLHSKGTASKQEQSHDTHTTLGLSMLLPCGRGLLVVKRLMALDRNERPRPFLVDTCEYEYINP